jgi:hypothetical protein
MKGTVQSFGGAGSLVLSICLDSIGLDAYFSQSGAGACRFAAVVRSTAANWTRVAGSPKKWCPRYLTQGGLGTLLNNCPVWTADGGQSGSCTYITLQLACEQHADAAQ